MVPYAAFPDLLKPEAPSPREFHQKSLDIAKQRLNLPGSVMHRSTNDKTRLLSGMLSAWSVSTPYSIEENPAKVSEFVAKHGQFKCARILILSLFCLCFSDRATRGAICTGACSRPRRL